MQPTRSLTSLKGLLGSIHKPLPLNQRESERLLKSLTTSFRTHLDKEHGFLPDEHAGATSTTKTAPPSPGRRSSASSSSSSHKPSSRDAHMLPTDRHLRSILSNPLFSYDLSTRRTESMERDPMDVFDEAVAKGLMTPLRAAGCLKAKHREIVESASVSIPAAMARSGAGLKVVRWLRSSGLERGCLAFVSGAGAGKGGAPAGYPLLRALMPFMVAEGLDELLWSWMGQLAAGVDASDPANDPRVRTIRFMLWSLVGFKASSSATLDGAYASLLRGQEALPGAPARFLLWPWMALSWASTIDAWQHPSPPSPKLFDSFSALGAILDTKCELQLAHLRLHHPTHPDHSRAMQILHDPDLWRSWRTRQLSSSTLRPMTVQIRAMGLDTVHHLSKHGETEQAQSLMRFLRKELESYFDKFQKESRVAFPWIHHFPRLPQYSNV